MKTKHEVIKIPQIGDIVFYRISKEEVKEIEDKRRIYHNMRGNVIDEFNDLVPLIITRVWGMAKEDRLFNGQVLLDGNDTLWVTSTKMGENIRECLLEIPENRE